MIIQNLDFGDKLHPKNFKPVIPILGRHEGSNHIYSLFWKYTNSGPQPDSEYKKFTIPGTVKFDKVYEYLISDQYDIKEGYQSDLIWCNESDLDILLFMQDKIIDSFNIIYGLIDPFNISINKKRISVTVDGYEVIIYYHEINKNTDMKKQKEEKNYTGTCVSASVGFSNEPLGGNDIQISETRFCRRELGTFKFITFYKEIDGTDKDVTVILTINYDKKNYSIDPGCGPKTFIFNESMVSVVSTKNKSPMWKAVLQSINDAIDFAEKELKQ